MNVSRPKDPTHPIKAATIATRGSLLALWQANHVSGLLQQQGVSSSLNVIKTTGDAVQDRFLHEIGGKGLFIKELEEALMRGEADLAVHSLKDLPARVEAPFVLAAVLPRHSVHDVIIFRKALAEALQISASGPELTPEGLAELGPITVASSSLRRSSLVRSVAPRIKMVPVRGNVDTRIRKLDEGQFDALILAEASIDRLGLKGLIYRRLARGWFTPCAGQGALAIETLGDGRLTAIAATLNCAKTMRAVTIERNVLRDLGGDCTMPFGCLVEEDPKTQILSARAIVLDKQGLFAACSHEEKLTSEAFSEKKFSDTVLEKLSEQGVETILKSLGIPLPSKLTRH